MYEGGSGLSVMMQVKFMVLPSLRNTSGPPMMAVLGSAKSHTCLVYNEQFWTRNMYLRRLSGHDGKEGLLTCNVEHHHVAGWWRGRYLTLVFTTVPMSCWLYLQNPVLRPPLVDHPEPAVWCVGEPANGEQVSITVPQPRYLKTIHTISSNSSYSLAKYIHKPEPSQQICTVSECPFCQSRRVNLPAQKQGIYICWAHHWWFFCLLLKKKAVLPTG